MQSFLAGADVEDGQSSSPLALHAKATALYAHAFRLASKYKDGEFNIFCHINPHLSIFFTDQVAYEADLFRLDNYITAFTAKLAFGDDARSEANQHSLVARILARVALIQLHSDEPSGDSRHHDACMAAANSALAVIENLKIDDIKYLDPIMAVSPLLHISLCQQNVSNSFHITFFYSFRTVLDSTRIDWSSFHFRDYESQDDSSTWYFKHT